MAPTEHDSTPKEQEGQRPLNPCGALGRPTAFRPLRGTGRSTAFRPLPGAGQGKNTPCPLPSGLFTSRRLSRPATPPSKAARPFRPPSQRKRCAPSGAKTRIHRPQAASRLPPIPGACARGAEKLTLDRKARSVNSVRGVVRGSNYDFRHHSARWRAFRHHGNAKPLPRT